jgi:acetyltransferase-like isoleucine patch superfamily enzyme
MLSVLKSGVRYSFVLLVFPFALLCGFGRVKYIFSFFAQTLALIPGLPGSYLRTAYYFLTLNECSILSATEIGTFFAHSDSKVSKGALLGAYCIFGHVVIGERTRIASGVQVLSGQKQHTRDAEGRLSAAGQYTTIHIGADCWIGAGAIIMADVGDRVTVSAGAVIANAVPDGATVAGNPARIIRTAT